MLRLLKLIYRGMEAYKMDCPYLKSESKGWFGYENTCEVLGIVIGDEHDRTKVEELCEKDYDRCPLYQKGK